MKRFAAAVCFLLLLASLCARAEAPNLVLKGDVTPGQNKTYIEVPFRVPENVHRISVDFSYTTKDQHTTLDLGIEDPYRFRGASGGNKPHFTISETDATPSYLPGAIPAGQWKLLIAVPNIRATVTARYRAEIHFNNAAEDSSFTAAPLETGKRWYRGDLHMHTAHSDGSCASQSGKRIPCPLFLSAQAATDRGLDFIAISDHNTDSQYDAMRELQPYFDRLLFIPAREITTFWGHFNIFGTTRFIDFRETAHRGLDLNSILRDVRARGAIASINHADAPTGEGCMGCGWTPPAAVDMSLFTGVEVINGGVIMLSSEDIWDRDIAKGHRLTAIGGSDNHNALIPAGQPGAIGRPTTVIEASELSVPAILDGIRKGRVFIDLTSSRDKTLDLEASAGSEHARMGGDLTVATGQEVELGVQISGCAGDTVHLLLDGREETALPPIAIPNERADLRAQWQGETGRHWLRAEIRDSRGTLLVLSNPVYINFPPR